MDWTSKVVLVTGGTGSFGQTFTDTLLREKRPKKLIILSRDELKQHDMRQRFPDTDGSPVRYFIGDVRDKARLDRAFRGVDIVVHAAALKQVPACEYNPFEAIQTNVNGSRNVIDAAIDQGVERVIAISTDKAVNPSNLYGATKLCAEKLFVQGNSYATGGRPRMACARYGNVVGSRGSVVPIFQAQAETGVVTITDPRMTRFWLTLDQGVRFVIECIEQMEGGEIFVPKIPSMSVPDVARALAPNARHDVTGIRPGEKLHEILLGEDEARQTVETEKMYVIRPAHPWWGKTNWSDHKPVPEGFSYASNTNDSWLSADQLRSLIG